MHNALNKNSSEEIFRRNKKNSIKSNNHLFLISSMCLKKGMKIDTINAVARNLRITARQRRKSTTKMAVRTVQLATLWTLIVRG